MGTNRRRGEQDVDQGPVPVGSVADEFDVLKVLLPGRFGLGLRSRDRRPSALEQSGNRTQKIIYNPNDRPRAEPEPEPAAHQHLGPHASPDHSGRNRIQKSRTDSKILKTNPGLS